MRWALLLAIATAACSTHVGVERGDPRAVGRELSRNAVATGEPSIETTWELNRLGLASAFDADPAGTLLELHRELGGSDDLDRLFALAELSYLHAERTHDRSHFLAAAVYAFGFLMRNAGEERVRAADPRSRLAGDLYDRGLTRAFEDPDTGEVAFAAGLHALPFGTLELAIDPRGFTWGGYRLARLESAAELEVRGVRNRYRSRGIGAPLVASVAPIEGRVTRAEARRVPDGVKVPVTAVLRIDSARTAIASGAVSGRISLYAADETESFEIDGFDVPLEIEWTSALADTLSSASFPPSDLLGARSEGSESLDDANRLPDGLFMLQPHRRGRIPVVLVHGTASSPGAWADLVNELMSDSDVRHRFEFWYFSYRTTSPLAYSGALLREALGGAVRELDPGGADPALREMVVIGHSQGGLLAHLVTIRSGDAFWQAITSQPFEQTPLAPEVRDVLRRSLFFEPLPFVSRVIFISTPHHGSFLAAWRIEALTPWIIRLPSRITSLAPDLLELRSPAGRAKQEMKRIPSSMDNMTPGNGFLETLAAIPVAPWVTTHSIIPVKGDGAYESGDDGIVAYSSAHFPTAESEIVIPNCSHRAHEHPLAIREVRRILREHLRQIDALAER